MKKNKKRTYYFESTRPPYPMHGSCYVCHTECPLNVDHLSATMTGVVEVTAENKDEAIALMIEKLCSYDVPVSVVFGGLEHRMKKLSV